MTSPSKLLFDSVLLPQGWARDIAVEIDNNGDFTVVGKLGSRSAADYQRLSGCIIPGMPNCHSHAHQRAMAGLGEKAGWNLENNSKEIDSFWTWRAAMYHYLERIQPDHLYAISRQLYLEMLRSGYTSVAEFQYLHHDQRGNAYASKAEMTMQCMQAACDLGLGFTALPVLYRYGGFGGQAPLEGQRRFLNNAGQFCAIVDGLFQSIGQSNNPNCAVGIAPHSLRAITGQLLNEVLDSLAGRQLAAIHVHIAEQTKEVEDCLAWCGQRPVQWLLNGFDLDPKWCLIHATHMNHREISGLAHSGAVAGLCPTTEANLGDGFFNMVDYVEQEGVWAIGSDSHISISPVEELRWLEYGQRLLCRRRNVMAHRHELHTGSALYASALAGGAQSSGRKIGRIAVGYRADFLVLDDQHPRLYGRCEQPLMDSWIFSGNENPVQDVYTAGVKVIEHGHHHDEDSIESGFKRVIDELADL